MEPSEGTSPEFLAISFYTAAIESALPEPFLGIFSQYYRGPSDVTLKVFLMNDLQYTRNRLKGFFGNQWDAKLSILPTEVQKIDVTFLHHLFQAGCAQVAPTETTDYLSQLVNLRNIRAHVETHAATLSVQHHRHCLNQLRNLCQRAMDSVQAPGTEQLRNLRDDVLHILDRLQYHMSLLVN